MLSGPSVSPNAPDGHTRNALRRECRGVRAMNGLVVTALEIAA